MLTLCNIKTNDGIRLYGTLHKAKYSKKPLVVIAHGYFSSNRVGPHRLYYQIANALEKEGYNVVRFDLRGIGESDGNIEDVKFLDHVSDLETIITIFRQRFNDTPVILIAHCIGCNLSLQIIGKHPTLFRKIIFISPYFSTQSTINAFFTQTQQNELYNCIDEGREKEIALSSLLFASSELAFKEKKYELAMIKAKESEKKRKEAMD